VSTTFTAQEAQREYPDADVSWDEWCDDIARKNLTTGDLARAIKAMTPDEFDHWQDYVDRIFAYAPLKGTS
jgi:hypothetical protein